MRSWFVIPVAGLACGAAALASGITLALALTGAALAALVRALAGDAPAAQVAALAAPLIAVASFAEVGGHGAGPHALAALALAAATWTVTELARDDAAPLVAVLPAAIAGALDPSFAALLLVAAVRVVQAPLRPRWAFAVVVAGGLAIALAVIAGVLWPALGARWFGAPPHPVSLHSLVTLGATTLGPITAVAALAGLMLLARPRRAELALIAAVTGAVLVDLRAGTLGPASVGLAAVLAGLSIGRLAAMIRLPSGQAIAGATIGALVIAPPALTAIAQRTATAHIAHASR